MTDTLVAPHRNPSTGNPASCSMLIVGLVPNGDGTLDLGSDLLPWRNVHCVTVTASESIRLKEVASSPNSVADTGLVYTKADGFLYWRNSSGTERVLTTTVPP